MKERKRLSLPGVAPAWLNEDEERRERWAYLTEDIKDDLLRRQVETMLDNEAWYMDYLEETSQTSNVGTFTTFAFPLVRRIYPKLIATELVSVQPMTQPTGKIFYLDFKYNTGGQRIDTNPDKTYANATEGGAVKEINFDITSVTVEAGEKKLKAKWTIEAQQDLMAYHGLDAETELMGVCGDEITREIDRDIIDDVVAQASAGNVNWSKTIPTTAPWNVLDPKVYKETLYDAIIDANNMIFKKRYRNASWIVADPDTCTRFEKLEKFKLFEGADDATMNMGVIRFGTLANKYRVYKDPWFAADKILLGYKGPTWLETGYVYAPYIPLYVTPLIIDPNDFIPRRGMMSRFAKKVVSGDFFATVTLTGS
ncbi:MAG: phage major capsid protein [Thermodesulfobacteriota bacterium]